MRFTTSTLLLLVAAALVGGCDGVTAPKPDTRGDAAFLTQTRKLCSAMPSLLTLDGTGNVTALVAAANTNSTNVSNLQQGILGLTPSLSDASPLAPTITDLEEMLADMAFRYKSIANAALAPSAAQASGQLSLGQQIALASTRTTQAIADLNRLGIDGCLHQ